MLVDPKRCVFGEVVVESCTLDLVRDLIGPLMRATTVKYSLPLERQLYSIYFEMQDISQYLPYYTSSDSLHKGTLSLST